MIRDKNAQTTFEYIIFFAGVIVVLLVFLGPSGYFRKAVEKTLNRTVNQINIMVDSVNIRQ